MAVLAGPALHQGSRDLGTLQSSLGALPDSGACDPSRAHASRSKYVSLRNRMREFRTSGSVGGPGAVKARAHPARGLHPEVPEKAPVRSAPEGVGPGIPAVGGAKGMSRGGRPPNIRPRPHADLDSAQARGLASG